MKGAFEQLLGKTISAVYCRENESTPNGQVFLIFDDDTHFELYSPTVLHGAGGIDSGGLEKVRNLNFPKGDEWVYSKPIISNSDNEIVNFELSECADNIASFALSTAWKLLKSGKVYPEQLLGLAKAIDALSRMPETTPGVNIEFGISLSGGNDEYHETQYISFIITETSFDYSRGGSVYDKSVGSDSFSEPGFYIEAGGNSDEDCGIDEDYLEELRELVDEYLNLGAEIVVSDDP